MVLKYGLYYNGTVLPTISDNNDIYVSPSPLNFVAATRSGVDIPYATLATYRPLSRHWTSKAKAKIQNSSVRVDIFRSPL